MKCLFLPLVLICGIANAETISTDDRYIDEINASLSNVVTSIIRQHLDITTAKPDTNITDCIRIVDGLGKRLLDLQVDDDRVPLLNEKIVAVIEALKDRRSFKYMLWAEGVLERVTERVKRGNCSEQQKIQLYLLLGEINASLVSENMLNREIMSMMAEIYDGLSADKKILVRRKSIAQHSDALSRIGMINPRKSLDDF